MAKRASLWNGSQGAFTAGLVSAALLGVGGCAGEPPKPLSPTVTPDHVRGHTEKAFENLKQEERGRGVKSDKSEGIAY